MRRRLILTEEFVPSSHIGCVVAETAMESVNNTKEPTTVQALIDALPDVVQSHVATCHAHYPCLAFATTLAEATQLQPL